MVVSGRPRPFRRRLPPDATAKAFMMPWPPVWSKASRRRSKAPRACGGITMKRPGAHRCQCQQHSGKDGHIAAGFLKPFGGAGPGGSALGCNSDPADDGHRVAGIVVRIRLAAWTAQRPVRLELGAAGHAKVQQKFFPPKKRGMRVQLSPDKTTLLQRGA
jgi:hypothetical protein